MHFLGGTLLGIGLCLLWPWAWLEPVTETTASDTATLSAALGLGEALEPVFDLLSADASNHLPGGDGSWQPLSRRQSQTSHYRPPTPRGTTPAAWLRARAAHQPRANRSTDRTWPPPSDFGNDVGPSGN